MTNSLPPTLKLFPLSTGKSMSEKVEQTSSDGPDDTLGDKHAPKQVQWVTGVWGNLPRGKPWILPYPCPLYSRGPILTSKMPSLLPYSRYHPSPTLAGEMETGWSLSAEMPLANRKEIGLTLYRSYSIGVMMISKTLYCTLIFRPWQSGVLKKQPVRITMSILQSKSSNIQI